jgi:hypothetical protein
MRSLILAAAFAALTGCTCSGCHPAAVVDAGQAALEVTAPDAGATEVALAEDAGEEDEAEGDALPPEIAENPQDEQALIAAFARDCNHQVNVEFEDMNGTNDAGECSARAFDQNCSPDRFGCWDASEKCRDDCANPCQTCEAKCGSSCEACKTQCDGGDCLTTCAVGRNDCRISCLHRLQTCRSTDCQRELDACDADAQKRTTEQCPQCDELRDCLLAAMEASTEPAKCAAKFPRNAAECLEWCSPNQ